MGLQIGIAEGHEIVRRGLRAIIAEHPGWIVAGEAADGIEAIEMAGKTSLDVLILADSLPRLGGTDAIRRLRAASSAKILVLCSEGSEMAYQQALDAGAQAILLKSDGAEELIFAIAEIAAGRVYLTQRHAANVMDQAARRPEGDPHILLTARERELVQHICQGATNKEIAGAMAISVRTVETYRAAIKDKLGLRSTGELIRWALRNHLIEP